MTAQGILVALAGISLLIVLVLRMTMTGRLYVGYSVIWLVCLGGGALLLVTPSLLRFVTASVGAVFPVSAVSLLALLFIFLTLIYFSCQLTILSNRLTAIAQYVALRDIERRKSKDGVGTP